MKSRKNNPLMLFNSANFCKLAVLKKHSLRFWILEFSVLRIPALRQYFFRCTQHSKNAYQIECQIFVPSKKLNPDQKLLSKRSEFIFYKKTNGTKLSIESKTNFRNIAFNSKTLITKLCGIEYLTKWIEFHRKKTVLNKI